MGTKDDLSVAAEDWRDYREGSEAIEHLAAYGLFPQDMVITGGEEPEVVSGAAVSPNFFRTLGVDVNPVESLRAE